MKSIIAAAILLVALAGLVSAATNDRYLEAQEKFAKDRQTLESLVRKYKDNEQLKLASFLFDSIRIRHERILTHAIWTKPGAREKEFLSFMLEAGYNSLTNAVADEVDRVYKLGLALKSDELMADANSVLEFIQTRKAQLLKNMENLKNEQRH